MSYILIGAALLTALAIWLAAGSREYLATQGRLRAVRAAQKAKSEMKSPAGAEDARLRSRNAKRGFGHRN